MNKDVLRIVLKILLVIVIFTNTAFVFAEPVINIDNISTDDDNFCNYSLPPVPNIDAVSAIVIESELGQVLYEKHPDDKLHISAACKIMTALLAIEKAELNAKITISKEVTKTEGSVLELVAGEKYSMESLVYAIMLNNYNDAALALSEHIAGDIENFVTLMNNMAANLKMNNTFFANSTGLFNESQYTTANDLSILIRYALKNPKFERIFSTQAMPWTANNGDTTVLTNQNELFWIYDGVNGGKTGFNNKEQQTAITTASQGNMHLICIVLDSPEKGLFTDSIKLLDFGFSNFKKGILVRKSTPLSSMVIQENEINVVSMNDVYYTYPLGKDYIKSITYNLSEDVSLPLFTNTIVGTARYILEDTTIIDINLYPDREIMLPEEFYPSIKKKFQENRDILILAGFLVIIELILLIYNIIKLIRKVIIKLISLHRNQ